jgi:hypothetical protein
MGLAILAQEIASALGIEKNKVIKELKGRQDIAYLRGNGDEWRIPTGDLEFDL